MFEVFVALMIFFGISLVLLAPARKSYEKGDDRRLSARFSYEARNIGHFKRRAGDAGVRRRLSR
jgi:hypothetical protein